MIDHDQSLRVNVPCSSRLGFRAIRRGLKARLEKQIPFLVTGDEEFDQFASVEGFPHDELLKFFRLTSARDAVSDLLTMGYDEVVLAQNQLSAVWTFYPKSTPPSRELLDITQNRLNRLARALVPAPPPAQSSSYRRPRHRLRWTAFIALLSLALYFSWARPQLFSTVANAVISGAKENRFFKKSKAPHKSPPGASVSRQRKKAKKAGSKNRGQASSKQMPPGKKRTVQ